MGDLAPAFAEEIQKAIENFEWHPGASREKSNDFHLPPDIEHEIKRQAHKHGLDTSDILLDILRLGLAALSSGHSFNQAMAKIQSAIARRAQEKYELEHPTRSDRKRPRSKIA